MEAKIHKADWRCLYQEKDSIRQSIFPSTNHSFGALQIFNDDALKPQGKTEYSFETEVLVLLIPLVGAIDYSHAGRHGFVHVNQMEGLSLRTDEILEISNPYPDQTVRYLLAVFEVLNMKALSKSDTFDLSAVNQLHQIYVSEVVKVHLGVYNGRQQGNFVLENTQNGVLALVLQGAFEFENRLLEASDALEIVGVSALEFEALSEAAILLLFDLKM